MIKNVRRGDTVVTTGGIVGKVTKVTDDAEIEVEIADGVRVQGGPRHDLRGPRQGRAGQGLNGSASDCGPSEQRLSKTNMLRFSTLEDRRHRRHHR